MSELPDTWSKVKIVDVLEPNENGKPFQQGWSPQCEKTPASNGAWGVLKTTAIQRGEFLPFENKALPARLEPRPHIEVKAGDILMTCAGPRNRCGVACLVKDTQPKLMMSGKMYRFRPDTRIINPRYLESYLHARNATQAIDRMKTGISDSGLNLTHSRFAELDVSLPPIKEQLRIIEKIDELLSELNKSLESLSTARQQIDLFYQSVLDSSFADLKQTKYLKELIAQKLSNGYSGKPVKYETKYRVLSLSATTSGIFDDSHYKYLDEEGLESRDIWCKQGDILIQRGNTIEYVGVPAIYTGATKQFIFPDLMIRVRGDKRSINTKYLYYALSSPRVRNHLRSKAKGSAGTMPKISQAILNELPIPYCRIESQEKIVADIENKLSNCISMGRTIDENIQRASLLHQSILLKAFSGRLMTQDPNDEPASVLLKRVNNEKSENHRIKKEKKRRGAA